MNAITVIRPAAALACAAALAAACAAPAGAATKPTTARFRAVVEGVQTTRWTIDHADPPGPCAATYKGSGRERLDFATRRAVTLNVTRLPIGGAVFSVGDDPTNTLIPATARVNRQGSTTITPYSDQPCGTGNGLLEPLVKPDCGPRTKPLTLMISAQSRPVNSIGIRGLSPSFGLYKRCPVSGVAFPNLLALDKGKPIQTPWPEDEIFDRTERKIIILGRGADTESSGGDSSTTTLRWTLTLLRVK